MIADWRRMVTDVSLFEVADVPTNWYVYSIPKKLEKILFQRHNVKTLVFSLLQGRTFLMSLLSFCIYLKHKK